MEYGVPFYSDWHQWQKQDAGDTYPFPNPEAYTAWVDAGRPPLPPPGSLNRPTTSGPSRPHPPPPTHPRGPVSTHPTPPNRPSRLPSPRRDNSSAGPSRLPKVSLPSHPTADGITGGAGSSLAQARAYVTSSFRPGDSAPTASAGGGHGESTQGQKGKYVPPQKRQESIEPTTTLKTFRGRSSSPAVVPTLPPAEYIKLSEEHTDWGSGDTVTPKLLVLDLNGALIYRVDNGSGPNRASYPRPYLSCFLDYLFLPDPNASTDSQESPARPWEVFVWSSAQPHNVRRMVENGFGQKWSEGIWEPEFPDAVKERQAKSEGRLLGVWARDKMNLSEEDYSEFMQRKSEHVINNMNHQVGKFRRRKICAASSSTSTS